jgi:hypothetical protein
VLDNSSATVGLIQHFAYRGATVDLPRTFDLNIPEHETMPRHPAHETAAED